MDCDTSMKADIVYAKKVYFFGLNMILSGLLVSLKLKCHLVKIMY